MAVYFCIYPVTVPTMIGVEDGLLSECGASADR